MTNMRGMAGGLPRHGGKGVTHRAFDVTNHNLRAWRRRIVRPQLKTVASPDAQPNLTHCFSSWLQSAVEISIEEEWRKRQLWLG